jgi:membrane protease YdiL (CAAX protease family)
LLNYLTSLFYAALAVDSPAAFSGSAYESDGMAVLCIAVLPAFFEELFFRGALYSTLRGGVKSSFGKYRGGAGGLVAVVLISALLFMLLHGPSWYFISDFYAGVLLALLVSLTGSLFSSMAAHLLANTASYFLAIYGGRLEAAGIENLTVHLVVICFLGAICHVLHLMKKLILFRAAEDPSRVNENSRRWEEQKKGEETYGNKRKKEGSR